MILLGGDLGVSGRSTAWRHAYFDRLWNSFVLLGWPDNETTSVLVDLQPIVHQVGGCSVVIDVRRRPPFRCLEAM